MPADTRQRLIEAAAERFYRDGFRNVGIDAILDDVGISKTAFYKHFESKDDLMLAVLDNHDRQFQQKFRDLIRARGGPSAAAQLRAVVDVIQHVIDDPRFHGCIFVNAVMEFPSPHDPVYQAATKHKQAIEDIVLDLAERAGADEPPALAKELGLIIEGAYVTRSVTRQPATIEIARRLAQLAIDKRVPSTAAV